MAHDCHCPSCHKPMRVPAGAVGRRIRCGKCETVASIVARGDDVALIAADGAAGGEPGADAVECAACGAVLAAGTRFCTACGAAVAGDASSDGPGASREADPAGDHGAALRGGGRAPAADDDEPGAEEVEARKADNRALTERRRGRRGAQHRRGKILRASRWIAILAVMFAAFGTIAGGQAAREAGEVDRQLQRDFFDEDEVEVDGEIYVIGELRQQIHTEARLVYVINYGLAAIMLGLFFWARRSPLPAVVTALCVYLVVVVGNAALDPSTIYRGLILKVFVIAVLLGGLQASLAERAVAGPAAAAHSAGRARRRRSSAS